MPRKTGKEILDSSISNDDRHTWLATATVDELYEFLRWVKQIDSSWALHGRDALNVVLAKENIKLQKDIRDMTEKLQKMTKRVIWLTVFIAFLTFIQVYPLIKTFFNDSQAIPKTENTTNQNINSNQIREIMVSKSQQLPVGNAAWYLRRMQYFF